MLNFSDNVGLLVQANKETVGFHFVKPNASAIEEFSLIGLLQQTITWYMMVGKLIIIPAQGHQNKGKSSFTDSGLFVLMSQCGKNIMSLPTTTYHVIVCCNMPIRAFMKQLLRERLNSTIFSRLLTPPVFILILPFS